MVTRPVNVSSTYIYYYSLTRKLQRRLIDILISLPSRTKLQKPPKPFCLPEHRPSIEELLQTTQHITFCNRGRIQCARCLHSLPAFGANTEHWLKGPCVPIPSNVDKPTRLHHSIIQIGRQSTHPSHNLTVYKGLLYCSKCGSKGIVKLHYLAHPCQTPGRAGLALLENIKHDRLPHNVHEWPFSLGVHAGTLHVADPELVPELADFRFRFDAIVRAQDQSAPSEFSGDSEAELIRWECYEATLYGHDTPRPDTSSESD
jgi:hypothetical protein